MFFNKGKKGTTDPEAEKSVVQEVAAQAAVEVEPVTESPEEESMEFTQAGSSYAFYKPDPYPKELVSVISKMLQRLFPDTKRAYLLEAQKSDKKGYLLIVDIDSKFLKIINIYLDGETKRVRGDIPIECVLYSKSGALTEGIDPFYAKESAESKANNLASKEFSGEVVFSQMPEFELFAKTSDSDIDIDYQAHVAKPAAVDSETLSVQENNSGIKTDPKEEVDTKDCLNSGDENEPSTPAKDDEESAFSKEAKAEPEEKPNKNTKAKEKPATKKELFDILNKYCTKKLDTVSAVAIAAIKEYEFYIPYTLGKDEASDLIDTSLSIDSKLRFKKVINPENEIKAVPLFTQKEDALAFAQRDNCKTVCLKYKDFASSRAAELSGFDGVVINPDNEAIFLSLSNPLLG